MLEVGPETVTGTVEATGSDRDYRWKKVGSLRLAASVGRGVGPNIKYMPEWKAFGWFMRADRVEWDVVVPKAGYYEVWLEWSITDEESGKPWDFRMSGNRLIGAIGKTGSWETYRKMSVGRIELRAGPQQAVFQPGGSFDGPLLDLREIRLVPVESGGNTSSK